jgi:hypothetical protein
MAEWGHVRRGYSPPELARLFGHPPVKTAAFITPLTALGHDLAWSKLPEPVRRALCGLVSPLTWLAYGLQPASRPGTEIAASWRKPDSWSAPSRSSSGRDAVEDFRPPLGIAPEGGRHRTRRG